MAQFCSPFCRLPIGHARVREPAGGQHRRIVLIRHVSIGAIGRHVVKCCRIADRVTPLDPFGGCQRQGFIAHGIHHIDKRHFAKYPAEQVGAHIGDSPHQHAAGAAALGDDSASRRIILGNQMFACGNKIEKRILLGHELAVEMPALPVLGTPANMGDCINESAIDQAEYMG